MSKDFQAMFDLSEAFDYIERLVNMSPTVSAGMEQLIDYCEVQYPHSVWNSVRSLDFERDTKNLKAWFEHILLSEPPSDEITGFWFGLFNPVRDNKTSCALYISGSKKYPNEVDWMVWNEESYLPKDRNANSKVIHKIYRLLADNNLLGDSEYILCLGYSSFVVHSICNSLDPKVLFGKLKSRTIAVGFDSGDYIILHKE